MEANELIKVLVIEDHPIVRDGCQRIFIRRPDIEMVEASTATDGLATNKSFQPDVVVLDIGLPDASGFDILPKLLADNGKAAIIVLSMYGTQSFVRRLWRRARRAISPRTTTRIHCSSRSKRFGTGKSTWAGRRADTRHDKPVAICRPIA